MGEFPSKEHQFKPGHPGGPGRPKGTGLTDRLRKIVFEEDEGRVAEALMKAGVKAALKGDHRFWKEIFDRMDGKVIDQIAAEITKAPEIKMVDAEALKDLVADRVNRNGSVNGNGKH